MGIRRSKSACASSRGEQKNAVESASANPAKNLGVYDQMGSIAVGKKANFAVLDKDFNVLITIRNGKIIYKA